MVLAKEAAGLLEVLAEEKCLHMVIEGDGGAQVAADRFSCARRW